ncbi:hypothetical protein DB843_17445 [Xanthomonas perforans]|nr:hypothetical protein DB843_17445 [Xanthomonas perforans]TQT44296.1 hypothetical protein EIJ66_09350 [Xanthomonas perforans]
MRAIGARALKRPRCWRGPGRGAGVGVRVRRQAANLESSGLRRKAIGHHPQSKLCSSTQRAASYPHPPLRGTFSRWEKGVGSPCVHRHRLSCTAQ